MNLTWFSQSWITRDLFVGELNFPSHKSDELDYFTESVCKRMLTKLLGSELYNLFVDEGYTEETSNIFYKLREGGTFEKQDGCVWNYEGLTEMMQYFIIAEMTGKGFKWGEDSTAVRRQTNNSENLTPIEHRGVSFDVFNKGVSKYFSAQEYLREKYKDFPTFKTQRIRIKTLIR